MSSETSNNWIQKIKISKLKKPKQVKTPPVSNEYNEFKNQLSNSSGTSNQQLTDYSFFINEQNDLMDAKDEFDLNNNDLTYSSLCFDNIDLTHTDTNNTTNNKQEHDCLGVKFINLNHNPDLNHRSNSVPVRNYDLFNTKAENDLNNIDLNYSSLYFETVDLSLPTTSSQIDQSFDFNHFNQTNGVKFINTNHNPDLKQRSNSVPVINNNVNKSFDLVDSILEDKCEASKQTQELTTSNVTTASNSPLKTKSKKSKSKKQMNDCLLNQSYLEMSEIANDGFDLKPLLKDYYNMVYTCMIKLCGYECENNSDLVSHLKEMHQIELINNDSITGKSGKLSYKCIFDEKTCGKKLETLNRIADHICKYHLSKIEYTPLNALKLFAAQSNLKLIEPDDKEQKEKLVAKINKNHICFNNILICSYNQCLWSFQMEEALKLHKLKHKCGLNFNDDIDLDTLKQKTKQPDRNYICTVCNSRFIRPSHLKIHQKSHEKSFFKCDYCPETFVKLSLLLTHINEKHKQNEKIFRCHYEGCTKSYYCKMYLTSHITKSHLKQENESEKICTECNMKFKQVWLKRQHDEIKHKKFTSQNVKTFKCTFEQCTKEFMTSSKLHRHNLTHLKAKSFKCEYENCDACFKRQYQLNSHLKLHSSGTYAPKGPLFKCDQTNCRSKFKSQDRLELHKQNHLSVVKNEHEDLSDEQTDAINVCLVIPAIPTIVDDSNDNDLIENDLKTNQTNTSVTSNNQQIFGLNNNNNFSNLVKQQEFKCIYCPFKFDTNENLNSHLKSHLDINKANQKLNEYLIEISRQKENIKYENDTENIYTDDQMKFIHENLNEENNYSYLLPTTTSTNSTNSGVVDNIVNNQFTNEQLFVKTNDLLVLNQSNNLIDYLNENIVKKDLKHVININSDDEEYVTCSVVLENLSGSARTDYKSNHMYIEKYRLKRKNNERYFGAKKIKVVESDEIYESINKSRSPSSPTSSSSLESSPSPPLNAQISNTKLIDTSKQTINENLKRKLKLKSKETNNCV